MKSKKFYSNLDVCVNFNNLAKKKAKKMLPFLKRL